MSRLNTVAQYFLSKESMSLKKLQKLVYYAYGWTLALLNESLENMEYHLFPNRIEAWVHGLTMEVPWLNARKGISPEIASSNLIKDIDIFFDQQAV